MPLNERIDTNFETIRRPQSSPDWNFTYQRSLYFGDLKITDAEFMGLAYAAAVCAFVWYDSKHMPGVLIAVIGLPALFIEAELVRNNVVPLGMAAFGAVMTTVARHSWDERGKSAVEITKGGPKVEEEMD